MDIIPILIPPITNHIVRNFCPFSKKVLPKSTETQSEYIIREYVWPLLSACIGFSWFLARNKAQITKKQIIKGPISKLFKGFQNGKLMLDGAFLLSWWMWLYSCEGRYTDAFYVLISVICALFGTIYVASSYTASSLLLLTPVIIWLFFTAEYTGKQFYDIMYPQEQAQETKDIE